jgi:putative phage-type endonuclease
MSEVAALLEPVGTLDRAAYLGGSDIAAIMGLSPYRTQVDVYLQKTRQAPPPKPDPARDRHLMRGKRMEPYVVQMLEEDHGITIVGRNNRYRDPEYPFMAAEIDFEWHDADPRVRNGEIKTVALVPGILDRWGEEGTDEVPVEHAAQSMWGLMLTPGRELCQYGTLFGMDQLVLYSIERDEETIANMREQGLAFWRNHVELRVPPPPRTLGDCYKLWPRVLRRAKPATPQIEAALRTYVELTDQIRVANEGREECEFLVKSFLEDHEGVIRADGIATANGERMLASFKEQTRESVDGAELRKQNREIYDRFVRTAHFRVLRPVKKEVLRP